MLGTYVLDYKMLYAAFQHRDALDIRARAKLLIEDRNKEENEANTAKWTTEETQRLVNIAKRLNNRWIMVAYEMPNRSAIACRAHWLMVQCFLP